jgi:hypothetical protein
VRGLAFALLLVQDDKVLDRYFKLLDVGLDYTSREDFSKNYPAVVATLKAEGADLEAILFRGEKKEVQSAELKALMDGRADTSKLSAEFRAVTGVIARRLLETFYDPIATRPLDEVLSEFGAPDYCAAYLRLSRDKTFLTHMRRENVRGPEVQTSGKPRILADAPSTSAEWAAFVRFKVGEDKQNFGDIDKAVAAFPENGFFRLARSYYHFFEAHSEDGLKALREGLSAKSFDPHTPDILDSLSAAHSGPLRYFAAVYNCATPQEDQFFDLATTHLSMLIEAHVANGKPDSALQILSLGLSFLDRVRTGALMLGEITRLLEAKARLLDRQIDLARDWKSKRAKMEVEWELAGLQFGGAVTDEFMMMAAGLLLEDEALVKYWESRRKANFDADRAAQAVKRFEAEIVPKLDKDPEFGGDAKDKLYVEAKANWDAGKFKEAADTASLVLQTNPKHLRALVLKRQAFSKITD